MKITELNMRMVREAEVKGLTSTEPVTIHIWGQPDGSNRPVRRIVIVSHTAPMLYEDALWLNPTDMVMHQCISNAWTIVQSADDMFSNKGTDSVATV